MHIKRFLRKKRAIKRFSGYSRKMRPVQGVSYPRSGHGAIFRIARLYFGEAFIYCDTGDKVKCGCESVPCRNPNRTFAKNHDFGLFDSEGVPIIPTERYLIQYRSPVRSIVSNYYLFRTEKFSRRKKPEWQAFALRSIDYWNRFVDKWVIDFPTGVHAPLICPYESLVSDPQVYAREILSYLGEGPLDEDAVCQVCAKIPISARNRLSKFRYYDAGFFRELEEMTSGRISKLGLPSFAEEI